MGQQQLLLLIVGVIIVAIAVVVGINQFGSSTDAGIVDNIIQTQQHLGSTAFGQYQKPASYGGKDFAKFAATGSTLITVNDNVDVIWTIVAADDANLASTYEGKTITTTVTPTGVTTNITP